MSWLFSSGDQSIGTSPLASVLPMNIQGWFPLGLTSLISLLSKGFSRVFSSTTDLMDQFFSAQPSLWSNSHIHTWLLEKPQLWLYRLLLAMWCLCFLYAVYVCHSFSSKEQASFNFVLQSQSTVILELKEISVIVSIFPHLFAMKWGNQIPWS